MHMYCDFVPRRKGAEIKMNPGRPESIGEYVRPLGIEDVKALFREGVDQIVEYNTTGFLVNIPPSECFEYWAWAQPHIAKGSRIYLDDYPGNFALTISEWKSPSGDRLMVFERHH